jgi:hypothetical protein
MQRLSSPEYVFWPEIFANEVQLLLRRLIWRQQKCDLAIWLPTRLETGPVAALRRKLRNGCTPEYEDTIWLMAPIQEVCRSSKNSDAGSMPVMSR